MKLLADFHTHTKNSRFFHGKNTIEEMAIAANELGLKEIGITDHGFNHVFRTSKEKLAKARDIVDEINSWSKTKVLLGIEADIISEDGTIDIDNETLSMIDILLVGYHKMIKTDFAGYFGGQRGENTKERATNAFVNAINKYPITVLVHPDSILDVDLYKIGCACRDNGVMVEINNRHNKWTEKQILDLLASECMFVVSSDAHSREAIGHVDYAFEIIRKYNIPSELVANVEFEEYERSEADKESDFYYGVYKQRQEEKEKKQQQLEEKRRKEFSNKLSNEMEEALLKIAKDQGIDYVGVEEIQDDDYDDIDLYNIKEADELLKETENMVRNGEYDDEVSEEVYEPEFDDDSKNTSEVEENEDIQNVEDTNKTEEVLSEDMLETEDEQLNLENEDTIEETPEKELETNNEEPELIEENANEEEQPEYEIKPIKTKPVDMAKLEKTDDINEDVSDKKEIETEVISDSQAENKPKAKPAAEKKRPRVHDFGRIASILEASEGTKKSDKK